MSIVTFKKLIYTNEIYLKIEKEKVERELQILTF